MDVIKKSEQSPILDLKLFIKKDEEDVAKKKVNRLLVPEVLALSLLPNRDAFFALRQFRDKLKDSTHLETTEGDSWLEYWAKAGKSKFKESTSAPRRKLLLQSALSVDVKHNDVTRHHQRARKATEHVSIRAYPVLYRTPQAGGAAKIRLVLVAFHLERHWVLFHIEKLKRSFGTHSLRDIKIQSNLIQDSQWRAFITEIRNCIALQAGAEQPTLLLHVPKGSPLKEALSREGANVVDDMAKEYDGDDRFEVEILRRRSKSIESLWFDLSSVDEVDSSD